MSARTCPWNQVFPEKHVRTDDVGAIIAEIEGKDGSGTLEAFFNNPSAINDLMRTLMKKGVIGQNEVSALMEGENKLSARLMS